MAGNGRIFAYLNDNSSRLKLKKFISPGMLRKPSVCRCRVLDLYLEDLQDPSWIIDELIAWLHAPLPTSKKSIKKYWDSNGKCKDKSVERFTRVYFGNVPNEFIFILQHKLIEEFNNNDGYEFPSFIAHFTFETTNSDSIIESVEELERWSVKHLTSATSRLTVLKESECSRASAKRSMRVYCRRRKVVDTKSPWIPSDFPMKATERANLPVRLCADTLVDIFKFLKRCFLLEALSNVCRRFRQIILNLMNNSGPYMIINQLKFSNDHRILKMNKLWMSLDVFLTASECMPPGVLFDKFNFLDTAFSPDLAALKRNPAVVNCLEVKVDTSLSTMEDALPTALCGFRSPSIVIHINLCERPITVADGEHKLRQLFAIPAIQRCTRFTIFLPRRGIENWRVPTADVVDMLHRGQTLRIFNDELHNINYAELKQALVTTFLNDTTPHRYTFVIEQPIRMERHIERLENQHTGETLCILFLGSYAVSFERREREESGDQEEPIIKKPKFCCYFPSIRRIKKWYYDFFYYDFNFF